jgi:ATP-dependent Clp endopeptidase proteolytic subunit ClpP
VKRTWLGRKDPTNRQDTGQVSTQAQWYKIQNRASSENVTDVWIYEPIGFDGFEGISASAFSSDFAAITSERITIHLNTPGGYVHEGVAIYNTIKQHSSHVTMQIEGMAASAGSFIALAGDEVLIAPTASVMIHDAAIGGVLAVGNAAELREVAQEVLDLADRLDKTSNMIAGIYAEHAGGTVEEWRAKMSQGDTWYSAEEAVEAGLADGILDVGKYKKKNTDEAAAPSDIPPPPASFDIAGLRNAMKGAMA